MFMRKDWGKLRLKLHRVVAIILLILIVLGIPIFYSVGRDPGISASESIQLMLFFAAISSLTMLYALLAFQSEKRSITNNASSAISFQEGELPGNEDVRPTTNQTSTSPGYDELYKTIFGRANEQLLKYYEINIKHINAIYGTATIVLIIGFGLIFISFLYSIVNESIYAFPSIITGVAGIVSELVGTVLLGYYKVAIQQANSFIPNFNRFSTAVGALRILDVLEKDMTQSQREEAFRSRIKIIERFAGTLDSEKET